MLLRDEPGAVLLHETRKMYHEQFLAATMYVLLSSGLDKTSATIGDIINWYSVATLCGVRVRRFLSPKVAQRNT